MARRSSSLFIQACASVSCALCSVTSRYWNMVHGAAPEQVKQDAEGLQTMRVLGNNMAYLLHCKDIAEKSGLTDPQQEPMIFTNFIR